MIKYIKSEIWDLLLIVIMSFGLAVNVFSSFYLSCTLASKTAVVFCIIIAVCFCSLCGFYNKKTVKIFLGILLVFITIVVVVAKTNNWVSVSTGASNSQFLAVTIIFIVCIIVTITTRSKWGVALVYVLGSIVLATFAFLKYPISKFGFTLFLLAGVVEFLFRNYSSTLLKAENGNYSLNKYFMQSLIVSLLALALSTATFLLIISPLSPKTHELKLITKLESFEILQVIGVSSRTEVLDKNLYSNVVNNQKKTTNKLDDTKKKEEEKETEASQKRDSDKSNTNNDMVWANVISYATQSHMKYIVLTIPPLLIGILIWLKLYLRRKRYSRMINQSNEAAVVSLYLFFVKKLRRLKICHNEYESFSEYAIRVQDETKQFSVGDVTFEELTDTYTKVIYGYQNVSDDEFKNFKVFYKQFYKNTRESIGTIKYALKFLTI